MTHSAQHTENLTNDTPVAPPLEGDQGTLQGSHTAGMSGWWPSRRGFVLYGLLIVLLVAGVPYGLHLWQYYQTHESTDDAFVVGDIVPISARVNGTVLSVRVENHQQVEAGQILARLDPQDFELQVQQAQAAVAVAKARLRRAEFEVPLAQESTRSDTARAQATQRAARAEWRASEQKLTQARSEVEQARVDLRSQHQAVERAQARVAEAQAVLAGSQANHQHVDIKQAQAQVARSLLQQAQADLDYARQQLAYTTIRAPATGRIAKNNLQIGQVVQVGRPLMAIVLLRNVWIEANFKETQLEHMRPGQKATLRVDAYPAQVFAGTVASISPGTGAVFSLLPPENATGNFVKIVQRVPVKILLDRASSSDALLRPGMSVIATVATH